MSIKKYSLGLRENTLINRIAKLIFGAFCLAVAFWFIWSLKGTASMTTSSWIAIIFLTLFGIWEFFSGFGLTERYIIINSNKIILRHRFYKPCLNLLPAMIKQVAFKPLAIDFRLKEGKDISVRLGTFYRERSAEIMEGVEKFCIENSIKTEGIEKQTEK